MSPPYQSLTVCGQRLEVRHIAGSRPDAPTVVFLHEGLGSISLWRDFPDRFAAAGGYPALIYSRRGYGGSEPLTPPYRRPLDYLNHEALEVLPALLDQCGIAKPILFGHSDGATIALVHAGAGNRAVGAVILEAPHIFVESITLAGIRDTCDTWRTTNLRQRLARHHHDVDGVFQGWAETWLDPDFARLMNIEALLPAITCPVLVLQGVEDAYGTTAQVQGVTSRVSGAAESLLIPDCGHAPHQERPDVVLDAALSFLSRTPT